MSMQSRHINNARRQSSQCIHVYRRSCGNSSRTSDRRPSTSLNEETLSPEMSFPTRPQGKTRTWLKKRGAQRKQAAITIQTAVRRRNLHCRQVPTNQHQSEASYRRAKNKYDQERYSWGRHLCSLLRSRVQGGSVVTTYET